MDDVRVYIIIGLIIGFLIPIETDRGEKRPIPLTFFAIIFGVLFAFFDKKKD